MARVQGITARNALERVLRLPAVGSKRFLTTKVDRCVTGLVAQQQCVGPLQLPLADVAVIAQSHFDLTGTATSIGEQPYKVRQELNMGSRPMSCCDTSRVYDINVGTKQRGGPEDDESLASSNRGSLEVGQ